MKYVIHIRNISWSNQLGYSKQDRANGERFIYGNVDGNANRSILLRNVHHVETIDDVAAAISSFI